MATNKTDVVSLLLWLKHLLTKTDIKQIQFILKHEISSENFYEIGEHSVIWKTKIVKWLRKASLGKGTTSSGRKKGKELSRQGEFGKFLLKRLYVGK